MKIINSTGNKAHVYYKGKYYIVSDNGNETLIFPSDTTGKIAHYTEVGGAIGSTLTEVIDNFNSFLFNF
jgi:hypothetical protein